MLGLLWGTFAPPTKNVVVAGPPTLPNPAMLVFRSANPPEPVPLPMFCHCSTNRKPCVRVGGVAASTERVAGALILVITLFHTTARIWAPSSAKTTGNVAVVEFGPGMSMLFLVHLMLQTPVTPT